MLGLLTSGKSGAQMLVPEALFSPCCTGLRMAGTARTQLQLRPCLPGDAGMLLRHPMPSEHALGVHLQLSQFATVPADTPRPISHIPQTHSCSSRRPWDTWARPHAPGNIGIWPISRDTPGQPCQRGRRQVLCRTEPRRFAHASASQGSTQHNAACDGAGGPASWD